LSSNPGWPSLPPPPSRGKSPIVWIVLLLGGGAAAVLCCGGGGLLFLATRMAYVGPPQALDGNWRCVSTGAIYTISAFDGHPRLVAIVDSDGEEFRIQESKWDGRELKVRFRVPSTGYSLVEELRLSGPDSLYGEYVSSAPDGSSSRSFDTWVRQ